MSVTFKRLNSTGTTLTDTGVLGQSSSISPVQTNELLTEEVLQRPTDNLRVRTEELHRAVTSLEYILQSVTNASVLLRYLSSTGEALSSVLKVYSKTFTSGETAYYILPQIPQGVATGSLPSLLVLGSATKSFNYVLNSTSLSAFYDQGTEYTENNHNRLLGLSASGDSICLRVPTVGSTYASEALLAKTTSGLSPAGEALISSTLATALATDGVSAAEATHSLIKLPSINSLTITPTNASLLQFLQDQVTKVDQNKESSGDSLSIEGFNSSTSHTTPKISFDLNGILDLGNNTYRLPRSGYRDLEKIRTSTQWSVFIQGSNTAIEVFTSGITFPSDTMLPKNEYLYPLAVYTGDAVLIPGLGGVTTIDIESRGGEALLDGSGVVSGETGTAASVYHTRCKITYENLSTAYASNTSGLKDFRVQEQGYDYFRIPIRVNIPEAGTGAQLFLKDLNLQASLNESYAQANNLSLQVMRDVYISIGIFNLQSDAATYTSSSTPGAKFSLFKCVPGIDAAQYEEESLGKLALTNFRLKDIEDNNHVEIKLTDEIRTLVASQDNARIIVWIYRLTNSNDFYTTTDSGDISLDFRMTFTTRLDDGVNLGIKEDLDLLNN